MAKFNFLTESEVERLKEYLVGYVSLPFGSDIPGEIVERLIARARGAKYVGKRANRPEPDMILMKNNAPVNYQIKTEKKSSSRVSALSDIGKSEDIITARIDVMADFNLKKLPKNDDELGTLVLRSYVDNVVKKYNWHKLAILLRYKQNNEFLYFEEDAIPYDPADYVWEPTSVGERHKKRNIIAYEKDANGQAVKKRKKFKWNAGTTLLYVFHDIPTNADYFEIKKKHIDEDAFRLFMEEQGYPSDEEIQAWILDAIETNEDIDRQLMPDIAVSNAVVKVSGEIHPKKSRDALLKTIWATPCVRDVEDKDLVLLSDTKAKKKLSQLGLWNGAKTS
ncbi:MAG TPA: hypothetical protein VF297_16060 [Pyrinomonadaceae bacterium]